MFFTIHFWRRRLSTAMTHMPDPDTTPRAARQYAVVFVLWTTTFAVGSQAMVVTPILPRIAEQLGVAPGALGTLVTAYAATVGLFALVVGPVSDRVGRRPVLLAGTGLLAGALALHGAAGSYASLLAVRALAGVAGGLLNGTAAAYVADYFPPDRRGWANGWVVAGLATGQIAGVPAGAVLADRLGFRWPFLAFAVLLSVTFVLAWLLLPRPAVEAERSRLTVRAALSGYAGLLRRPAVGPTAGLVVCMFLGTSLYATYLPTWSEAALGATPAAVAGMFFLAGVANVVAGPGAGRLCDRVGRKPVVVGASAAIAVLVYATAAGGRFAVVAGLFVLANVGLAARSSSVLTLLGELVEGDRRGSLLSATTGLGQFGVGVGGAAAGAAYAAVGYPATAAVAGTLMVGILAGVVLFVPETAAADGRVTAEAGD